MVLYISQMTINLIYFQYCPVSLVLQPTEEFRNAKLQEDQLKKKICLCNTATEDTVRIVSMFRYVTLSTQFYSVGITLRLRISGIIPQFPRYLHVFNRDQFLCCTLWARRTVFSCKSTFFYLLKNTSHSYFDTCTVHVLLFFTMTNKCTVNDHKLTEYDTIVSKHVGLW